MVEKKITIQSKKVQEEPQGTDANHPRLELLALANAGSDPKKPN